MSDNIRVPIRISKVIVSQIDDCVTKRARSSWAEDAVIKSLNKGLIKLYPRDMIITSMQDRKFFTFFFQPDLVEKLDKTARELGITRTDYLTLAILSRLHELAIISRLRDDCQPDEMQ